MRRAPPRRDASIKPAGDMSRRSSWIPAMPKLGRPWAVFRHNNSSTTLRGSPSRQRLVRILASETGGHAFHEVSNQDILPRILSTIAKEIRYDYVAGYYSSTSDSEKSRKVEVKWRSKSRGQIIGGGRVTTPK